MLKLIPQSFERRHILGMSARQRGSDRCKSHQDQAALHLGAHATRFPRAGRDSILHATGTATSIHMVARARALESDEWLEWKESIHVLDAFEMALMYRERPKTETANDSEQIQPA